MAERIFSYSPVVDEHCRVLVLGTAPSVESLRQGFYYAHPRNAFWRIMADIFGAALPESVPEKKTLLLKNRVALWDVARSCEREGSLDSAIRRLEANDIPALLRAHPAITKICFNGQAAEKLYLRHLGRVPEGIPALRLPSTSPAYTLAYENKLAAWRAALGG